MPYKEKCGFRDKVKVCTFKENDCTHDKCDMYCLEFDADKLYEKLKYEEKEMYRLEEQIKSLPHGEKKQAKELKAIMRDKFVGILYMSKAIAYLKRTNNVARKLFKKGDTDA
jgi:hypothetical protein